MTTITIVILPIIIVGIISQKCKVSYHTSYPAIHISNKQKSKTISFEEILGIFLLVFPIPDPNGTTVISFMTIICYRYLKGN